MRKQLNRWLIFSLLGVTQVGLPLNAESPASTPLTLEIALDRVRTNSPRMAAALNEIQAAEGTLRQHRRPNNPRLEFAAEQMEAGEFGDLSQTENTIGLRQEFQLGGKRNLRVRVAQRIQSVRELEFRVVERKTLSEARRAFFEVLASQEMVKVAGDLLKVSKQLRTIAQKRADAGEAPLLDVVRARIAVFQAKNEVTRRKRDLKAAQKNLLELMGQHERTLSEVVGALTSVPRMRSLSTLMEVMEVQNPEILARQNEEEVAELQIEQAHKARIPDFDVLLGAKTHPGERPTDHRENFIQLEFSLSLPILNRNQGAISRAKAIRNRARQQARETHLRLARQLGQALDSYNASLEQIRSYQESLLPAARQALDLTTRGYESGETRQLEALNAQQTLAETNLSYLESLAELHSAAADIEHLTGMESPSQKTDGEKMHIEKEQSE